jgi:[acyl-carrier-protein] S-malonyltransferase
MNWRFSVKKTAFLFPGQGSQSVGMGQEFYRQYDFVREIIDMAEEITRINISKLCFKGPIEDLTATVHLQPAITTVNLACLAVIKKEHIKYQYCAGHSLGEYSALCAAGVNSIEDAIRLVLKRGELMHRESTRHSGAMHAIVGLSIDEVSELVSAVQRQDLVAVANHNTASQIVVTGTPEAVAKVSALAVEKGARSAPLKVSGAWHSELIKGAEEEFAKYLEGIPFEAPRATIFFNVTAESAEDPDEIKAIMARQLCSPVRWYEVMCRLIKENTEVFVEVGPGKVLAGLLKKVLPKDYPGKVYNVSTMKELELLVNENA